MSDFPIYSCSCYALSEYPIFLFLLRLLGHTLSPRSCNRWSDIRPWFEFRSIPNIQVEVLRSLETEYFPDFLESGFHAKHQVDVLTGSGSKVEYTVTPNTFPVRSKRIMSSLINKDNMRFLLTPSVAIISPKGLLYNLATLIKVFLHKDILQLRATENLSHDFAGVCLTGCLKINGDIGTKGL